MDCSIEEESNRLVSLFHELIESEECRRLNYQCLLAPLTGIINNILLKKETHLRLLMTRSRACVWNLSCESGIKQKS